MLAWIALFLTDVAVRRVILDARAKLRRAVAWVTATTRQEKDDRIARLQARSQKLRAQWAAGAADGVFSKRYEGGQKYQGDTIVSDPRRAEAPAAKPAAAEPAKPKPAAQSTHIDQLLQARHKRTGGDQKG